MHMQSAKAQISLCINAVWSGPSLSANRIIGYYRIYKWRAKAGWYFGQAQNDLSVHFHEFSKARYRLGLGGGGHICLKDALWFPLNAKHAGLKFQQTTF